MDYNLPNFLIIGVMKGGTTSLNIALAQGKDRFTVKANTKQETFNSNPDINPNMFIGGMGALNHKELDFFSKDGNYKHGIDIYKRFFNVNNSETCTPNPILIGECSPSYFTLDEYPGDIINRIQRYLPDIKIILSLRDPIERAYSHFIHMNRNNWHYDNLYKNKTFREIVMGEWKHKSPNYVITRSFYSKNLLKYKSAFGDNLFVTTQENLLNDPVFELNKIYDFLGVKKPPYEDKQFKANRNIDHNPDYSIKNMDKEIKEYLRELFRSDVTQTVKLLPQVDFSYWNKY
jgi:hypothetical protein